MNYPNTSLDRSEAVKYFYSHGHSLIPLYSKGQPAVSWSGEKEAQTKDLKQTLDRSSRTWGVGVLLLGDWLGLDFDAKNFAGDTPEAQRETCDETVTAWLERYSLTDTLIVETPSGGFHVYLRAETLPDCGLFAFEEGGKLIGELRYQGTPYLVIPSSPGYTFRNFAETPKSVSALGAIGLYRARKPEPKANDGTAATVTRTRQKTNIHAQVAGDWSSDPWDVRNYVHLLNSARLSGSQVSCMCPVHEDNSPSLSIDMRSGVMNCHASKGCTYQAVKDAIYDIARRAGCKLETGSGVGSWGYRQRAAITSIAPTFNINERYLPTELIMSLHTDVLIKAQKGTGKSVFIGELIQHMRTEGYSPIFLTPRRSLGRALCAKWGMDWIEELQTGQGSSIDQALLRHGTDGLGLCFDSLQKLHGMDFSRYILILDEAELGVRHLLTSDTCRKTRHLLLTVWREMLASCNRVILSDADLSEPVAKYFHSYRPDAQRDYLLNTHYADTYTAHAYVGQQRRGKVIRLLIERLEQGHKVYLATDSKNAANAIDKLAGKELQETWGTVLSQIEEYAASMGKRVLNINGDTSGEPYAQEFMRDPVAYLNENQPDLVICTPAVDVGLSIDQPYFDAVFGLYFGVLAPSQFSQALARVRAGVDRHVWLGKTGVYVNPHYMKEKNVFDDVLVGSGSTVNVSEFMSLSHIFIGVLREQEFGEVLTDEVLEESRGRAQAIYDAATKSAELKLYCALTASDHYTRSELDRFFEMQLRGEGHEYILGEGEDVDYAEKFKEASVEVKQEYAQALADTENISDMQAERMQQLQNPLATDRLKLTKHYQFAKKLNGNVDLLTPEFIYECLKDHFSQFNAHRRFARLSLMDDEAYALQMKLSKTFYYQQEVFPPDLGSEYPALKLIQDIGLLEHVNPSDLTAEYTNSTPSIRRLTGKLKSMKYRKQLQAHLHYRYSDKQSEIVNVGRLLGFIGLSLKQSKRTGTATRERVYTLDDAKLSSPFRLSIINALLSEVQEAAVTEVEF